MGPSRPAVSTALVAALLGVSAVVAPAALAAVPTTCQGKAATVAGNTGTEGDDVMVVSPDRDGTAQALGGNDTICIAAAPEDGASFVLVDAGPGDDTVVNESTDHSQVWYTTVLGTGADSYLGLDAETADAAHAHLFQETVYAGTRDLTVPEPQGEQDQDTDVIDTRGGDDIVHSGQVAAGTTNNDVIRTGTGDDEVVWAGEMGSGVLDLGSGDGDLTLYPGWKGTDVAIDATTRTATSDGRTVLQWTGEIVRYWVQLDNPSLSFAGSSADETLIMSPLSGQVGSATPGVARSARMGRGDDVVALFSMGTGTVDGGPGHDTWAGNACSVARVRLGGRFTCTPAGTTGVSHTFGFDRFEDVQVEGGDVTVVGSGRADKIKVVAGVRVRVRARGGNDVVNVNTYGRLAATPPVVVTGGAGADRLVGSTSRDRLLGGPGDDTLFGDGASDELLGGAGRDKAFGQAGRDRCVAEARRTCER